MCPSDLFALACLDLAWIRTQNKLQNEFGIKHAKEAACHYETIFDFPRSSAKNEIIRFEEQVSTSVQVEVKTSPRRLVDILSFFLRLWDFLFYKLFRDLPSCKHDCFISCSCDGYSCKKVHSLSLTGTCTLSSNEGRPIVGPPAE